MIFNSLTFWTLVVGLLAFVVRWFFPSFPLDEATILSAVLFFLGLIGVYPQLRARGITATSIIHSLAFWQLVAGLVTFILHFFAPSFPFSEAIILAFFLFVLGYFNIYPELRMRGFLAGDRRLGVMRVVAGEDLKAGDPVSLQDDGTVRKSYSE